MIVGLILVTRFIPARSRQGNLSRVERVYLFSTPAPLVLTLILPDLVGLHFLTGGAMVIAGLWWSASR